MKKCQKKMQLVTNQVCQNSSVKEVELGASGPISNVAIPQLCAQYLARFRFGNVIDELNSTSQLFMRCDMSCC